MNLLPLLALLGAFQTQTGAPAQGPSSQTDGGEPKWTLVAGVAAQADGKILTLRELETRVEREATAQAMSPDDPNYAPLAWQVLERAVTSELEPQAGREIGLDAASIEHFVRSNINQERRQIGAAGFAEEFLSDGVSFHELERNEQDSTFTQLWQSYRLGGEALAGMRPIRDRFIRPGEVRAIYSSNESMLNPDIIQFQSVVAPVAAFGDEAAARAAMEDVRRRALAGEDFSRLVDEFSAVGREDQGISEKVAIPELAIPGLQDFARTAVVGDLSPLLPLQLNGQAFLMLSRVHAKTENEAPEFVDRNIQQALRGTFSRERDYRRLGIERERLRQRAFVWVTPRLEPLQQAAQRALQQR